MGATVTPSVRSAVSTSKAGLNLKKRHGRAVNAVAAFLNQSLRVPEIYLEFGGVLRNADVVAVDGAGSGDIHAVEVKVVDLQTFSAKNLLEAVNKLKQLPAHYRYLAVPAHLPIAKLITSDTLFSNDGLGRIGLLKIVEAENEPPLIEAVVKAERFRVSQPDLLNIQKVLDKSHPDIFVRV